MLWSGLCYLWRDYRSDLAEEDMHDITVANAAAFANAIPLYVQVK